MQNKGVSGRRGEGEGEIGGGGGRANWHYRSCHSAKYEWISQDISSGSLYTGWFAMIRPITFTPPADKSCRHKTRVDGPAFQPLFLPLSLFLFAFLSSMLSHSLFLSLSLTANSQGPAQTFRLAFIREIDHRIVPFSIQRRHRNPGKVAKSREIMLPEWEQRFIFSPLFFFSCIFHVTISCDNFGRFRYSYEFWDARIASAKRRN